MSTSSTNMTDVHAKNSSVDQSVLKRQREALEHQLESNWNGLLINDFLNCDTSAASDLWAAERRELERLSNTPPARLADVEVDKTPLSPREKREHELETTGNGLLVNDYLNCNASSAEALFENDREEMAYAEKSYAEKSSTRSKNANCPEEEKDEEERRDGAERALEQAWNGLVVNDWLNCDSSAVEELWDAERDQISRASSRGRADPEAGLSGQR
ncbi:uncharacterized protein PV09_08639 [Verruconis gallopava]|uniref:Uncharacterized protein n=1 Tax=Verruconis gallopava TaxID=253628 RepID=A0A0D2AKY5_9PEZI|nr:uncharacterized protein PV09_08639 [Verruconis gallopava]KIV99708.1 hypothetical protein PV09_08639 [Verruconis gallopava]